MKLMIYLGLYLPIMTIICSGPPKQCWGLRAKGNSAYSSNSPNNDIRTKSTTVSHKQGISIQQK